MRNIELLAVLTPLYIYHGCSTGKMLWEETFTPMNMKNCRCYNIRKHREIKNGKHYVVLVISLKFGNMDKIKIKYLEPKYYSGKSGEG